MSDLSTRVRLRREQLGLSQEELARRMDYRSRSSCLLYTSDAADD